MPKEHFFLNLKTRHDPFKIHATKTQLLLHIKKNYKIQSFNKLNYKFK